MPADIHLSDPMAEAELVQEIERRFGVRLNEHRVAACRTVGALYAYLLEMVGPAGDGTANPSTAALWRLRFALRKLYRGAELRPDTPLDEIGADLRRQPILDRVEELSGLTLPRAALPPVWGLLPLVPGAGLVWYTDSTGGTMLGVLVTLLLYAFSDVIAGRLLNARFARLPRRYATLDDLARAASLLNIGQLRQLGGIPERILWASFTDCLRTTLALTGPIEPDQRFLER